MPHRGPLPVLASFGMSEVGCALPRYWIDVRPELASGSGDDGIESGLE